MSQDKPLHVKVAEAVGWTNVHYPMEGLDHSCGDIMLVDCGRTRWKGRAPGEMLIGAAGCRVIPRFDADWSATGPLIEVYGLGLGEFFPGYRKSAGGRWYAAKGFDEAISTSTIDGVGDTPPAAVCHLILALKSAGKLDPTS